MLTLKLLETAEARIALGLPPRSEAERLAMDEIHRRREAGREQNKTQKRAEMFQELVRLYKAGLPLPDEILHDFAISYEPRKGFNEEAKFMAARKRR